MNPTSAIGITSSIALFVPVLLILVLRLFTNKSFLALAVYYLVVSIQNLMRQNVIVSPKWLYQSLGILNNFLDAPLMIIFLLFFSISAVMTKKITTVLMIFLAFESLVLVAFGFGVRSVKIVLGPDIALIAFISSLFFLRNVRLAITNPKSLGKAVMISSVLLSYSIFSLVYIFYYLVKIKQYREDAQLIYYLVTILSALLMAIGILIENKRIKKLGELRNTRRELASIYGHTNTSSFEQNSPFLNAGSR